MPTHRTRHWEDVGVASISALAHCTNSGVRTFGNLRCCKSPSAYLCSNLWIILIAVLLGIVKFRNLTM